MITDFLYSKIVSNISEKISEDDLNLILNHNKSVEQNDVTTEPFGTKIPYKQARVVWPQTDMLHDMNAKSIDSISSNFEELIKIHQPEPENNTIMKKAEVCLYFFT